MMVTGEIDWDCRLMILIGDAEISVNHNYSGRLPPLCCITVIKSLCQGRVPLTQGTIETEYQGFVNMAVYGYLDGEQTLLL